MFSHQYLKMCMEAKEDIEFMRTFIELDVEMQKPFLFKKGDYFLYPERSESEVHEVYRVEEITLRAVNNPYPYKINGSFWIPTVEQLIFENKRSIPLISLEHINKLYKQNNHVLSNLSNEEQVLSYIMEIRFKKIWDFEKETWI